MGSKYQQLNKMKEQVYVTGGTGFVGSNLIRLLLTQGYKVKALVRRTSSLNNLIGLDVEVIYGDLTDKNQYREMKGCSALFHVAAQYSLWKSDREVLYQNNVLGTKAVLESARQANISRIVYTSSVAAIGAGDDGSILDESHQTPVQSLIGAYKQSKYLAEQEAQKAVKAGQDIVVVNPTSPIGCWDQKPTPTGEIILRFLRRQMPFYLNTGLNLIDVEDVAWGHLLALRHGSRGKRYILGNENMTLKEILNTLTTLTGIPSPAIRIPYWVPYTSAWVDENVLGRIGKQPSLALDSVKMASKKMYYDSSLAIQELGLPQSPVSDALSKAVGWFKSHGYTES